MKTFCFDLDGVVCKTKQNKYSSAKPIKKVIDLINKLYEKNKIIIFTARYMGRSGGQVGLAKKRGYKFTKKQLKNWNVVYDELIFGKPSYDIFIDDKNLSFKKNWSKEILKKYK